MAQKRMFDKSITNSDKFLELPDSSQVLYFHLSMNADDDGFVDNWKSIMRMTGTKDDDLRILISKSYVIPFESGVIVIKHWRMNNYLRNDRYKETIYKKEKNLLSLGENEEYNLQENNVGIPMVSTEENRIEENRIEENNKRENIKEKEYFENEKINSIFIEFLELRKKIKAVNSDRAINTLINKLNKYDDDTKYKMIEKSIVNSWKDVYELKKEKESFNEMLDRLSKE